MASVAQLWGEMAGFFTLSPKAPQRATQQTLFLMGDELDASLVLCVTGWYRQAFEALRSVCERGLAAPYFDLAEPADYDA